MEAVPQMAASADADIALCRNSRATARPQSRRDVSLLLPIASLSPGGVEKSDLCPIRSQTFLLPRVTVARNRGAVPRLEARKSPRLRSTAL